MNRVSNSSRYITMAFGAIFFIIILWLIFQHKDPTNFQKQMLLIILSISAAAVATGIPGFLHFNFNGVVKCSGGMAIFIIVYFINPVKIISDPKNIWREQSMVQYNISNALVGKENPFMYITTSGKADVQDDSIVFVSRDVDFTIKGMADGRELKINYIVYILSCLKGDKYVIVGSEYMRFVHYPTKIFADKRTYWFRPPRMRMKRNAANVNLSECFISFGIIIYDKQTGKTYSTAANSGFGVFE